MEIHAAEGATIGPRGFFDKLQKHPVTERVRSMLEQPWAPYVQSCQSARHGLPQHGGQAVTFAVRCSEPRREVSATLRAHRTLDENLGRFRQDLVKGDRFFALVSGGIRELVLLWPAPSLGAARNELLLAG